MSSKKPEPPQDLIARGCGSLFFAIFAVAGLFAMFFLAREFLGNVRPYFWTKVPCTMVTSQRTTATLEKAGDDYGGLDLAFRYELDGQRYTARQTRFGLNANLDLSDTERLLLEYPVGSKTTCWVNPKTLTEATLFRPSLWPVLFLFFPLIFVGVGVGGIFLVWRSKTMGRGPIAKPAARPGAGIGGKMFGVLFGSIFILAGSAVFIGLTVYPLMQVQQAKSWTEVPCTILSSEVKSHRGSKGGSTYSVAITYSYRIGERELRSDRYSFTTGSSSGREAKAQIVEKYPVGTQAICYVNPQNPTETVIDRGYVGMMWFGLLGLLFIGAGSGVMYALVRTPKANTRAIRAGRRTPPPAAPTLAGTATGAVALKPTTSPYGKFFGAVFVALFWNGITGVFVGIAVKSWISGKPEWFLTIFITPFVLIGLALVAYIGKAFLNLFNPRIRLMVKDGEVPLGGKLELNWAFDGSPARIDRLHIYLEGREQARYRRGTNTVTDEDVFTKIPLVDTAEDREIAAGRAEVKIPLNVMHSWESSNNKIIWAIKVAGEIPRFPDIEEEFAVLVLPRSSR